MHFVVFEAKTRQQSILLWLISVTVDYTFVKYSRARASRRSILWKPRSQLTVRKKATGGFRMNSSEGGTNRQPYPWPVLCVMQEKKHGQLVSSGHQFPKDLISTFFGLLHASLHMIVDAVPACHPMRSVRRPRIHSESCRVPCISSPGTREGTREESGPAWREETAAWREETSTLSFPTHHQAEPNVWTKGECSEMEVCHRSFSHRPRTGG